MIMTMTWGSRRGKNGRCPPGCLHLLFLPPGLFLGRPLQSTFSTWGLPEVKGLDQRLLYSANIQRVLLDARCYIRMRLKRWPRKDAYIKGGEQIPPGLSGCNRVICTLPRDTEGVHPAWGVWEGFQRKYFRHLLFQLPKKAEGMVVERKLRLAGRRQPENSCKMCLGRKSLCPTASSLQINRSGVETRNLHV